MICKTQSVGKNLKEAMDNLKCIGEESLNPWHKAALQVDSKPVFKLQQVLKDDHQGKAILDLEVTEQEAKKLKREPKPKTEDEDDSEKEDSKPESKPKN